MDKNQQKFRYILIVLLIKLRSCNQPPGQEPAQAVPPFNPPHCWDSVLLPQGPRKRFRGVALSCFHHFVAFLDNPTRLGIITSFWKYPSLPIIMKENKESKEEKD